MDANILRMVTHALIGLRRKHTAYLDVAVVTTAINILYRIVKAIRQILRADPYIVD